MGTVLSGGQKQRVVIARALYRQPSILLLDEATSHLDVEREKMVNVAFGTMRVTRIIIAHRPETIRMSGSVLALEQGKIVKADAVYWSKTIEDQWSHSEEYIARRSPALEGAIASEESRNRNKRHNGLEAAERGRAKFYSQHCKRSSRKPCSSVNHPPGDNSPVTVETMSESHLPEARFAIHPPAAEKDIWSAGDQDRPHVATRHSEPESDQNALTGRDKPLSHLGDARADRRRVWATIAMALPMYFLLISICI
jgi:ABC-type glutathione transport system ATPase component